MLVYLLPLHYLDGKAHGLLSSFDVDGNLKFVRGFWKDEKVFNFNCTESGALSKCSSLLRTDQLIMTLRAERTSRAASAEVRAKGIADRCWMRWWFDKGREEQGEDVDRVLRGKNPAELLPQRFRQRVETGSRMRWNLLANAEIVVEVGRAQLLGMDFPHRWRW